MPAKRTMGAAVGSATAIEPDAFYTSSPTGGPAQKRHRPRFHAFKTPYLKHPEAGEVLMTAAQLQIGWQRPDGQGGVC